MTSFIERIGQVMMIGGATSPLVKAPVDPPRKPIFGDLVKDVLALKPMPTSRIVPGATRVVYAPTKSKAKLKLLPAPVKLTRAVDPAMEPVDPLLLEILRYCRAHESPSEAKFITKYISSIPGMVRDEKGNRVLYVGCGSQVMWSCHTDTVHHNSARKQVVYVGADGIITTPDGNCLGADNGAGIYVLLKMIQAGVPGVYTFHRGEERGGIGSKWRAENVKRLVEPLKYAIAFDRRGTNEIITHQGSRRTCSDNFAASLSLQLGLGHMLSTGGSFTDTKSYVELIEECTNVSVGYANEHRKVESLDWVYLNKLTKAMCKFDETMLVCERKAGTTQWLGYQGNANYDPEWYKRQYGHSTRSQGSWCGTSYVPATRPKWQKFGEARVHDWVDGAIWVDAHHEAVLPGAPYQYGKWIVGQYDYTKCKASKMPVAYMELAGIQDIAVGETYKPYKVPVVVERKRGIPNRHDRKKARRLGRTQVVDQSMDPPCVIPGYTCKRDDLRKAWVYTPIDKLKLKATILVDDDPEPPKTLSEAMLQDAIVDIDADDGTPAYKEMYYEQVLIDAERYAGQPELCPAQHEIDEAEQYFYGLADEDIDGVLDDVESAPTPTQADPKTLFGDLYDIASDYRNAVCAWMEDEGYEEKHVQMVLRMNDRDCAMVLVELEATPQALLAYV